MGAGYQPLHFIFIEVKTFLNAGTNEFPNQQIQLFVACFFLSSLRETWLCSIDIYKVIEEEEKQEEAEKTTRWLFKWENCSHMHMKSWKLPERLMLKPCPVWIFPYITASPPDSCRISRTVTTRYNCVYETSKALCQRAIVYL